MTTTLTEKTVKVSKPHSCEQCSRTIAIGEDALYWAGRTEWGFESGYQCERCTYLVGLLWAEYGDDDSGFSLAEVMKDYADEIGEHAVAIWKAPGFGFVRPAAARTSS